MFVKVGVMSELHILRYADSTLSLSYRLNPILNQVSLQKKKAFGELVLSYWTLKRQSRNGVPLNRRLQTRLHLPKNIRLVILSLCSVFKQINMVI